MNSPYQELKAIPKDNRNNIIWVTALDLQRIASELCSYKTCTPEAIAEAQSYLDKIKQLVLTRGDNEK